MASSISRSVSSVLVSGSRPGMEMTTFGRPRSSSNASSVVSHTRSRSGSDADSVASHTSFVAPDGGILETAKGKPWAALKKSDTPKMKLAIGVGLTVSIILMASTGIGAVALVGPIMMALLVTGVSAHGAYSKAKEDISARGDNPDVHKSEMCSAVMQDITASLLLMGLGVSLTGGHLYLVFEESLRQIRGTNDPMEAALSRSGCGYRKQQPDGSYLLTKTREMVNRKSYDPFLDAILGKPAVVNKTARQLQALAR